MKSMRVSLDHEAGVLSPIQEAIYNSPDIEREVVLGGQAVDGVETITSFVHGEPSAYESMLDEIEGVQEYDITPADDGFFLFLRRDSARRAGRYWTRSLVRRWSWCPRSRSGRTDGSG